MEPMNKAALLSLHAYNHYANDLVLETASHMTEDQLTCASSPSNGSVKGLLLHIAMCEYGFILRCTGTPLENTPQDFESMTFPEIRTLFATVAYMRKNYLDAVGDNVLNAVIPIQIRQQPLNLAPWQMLAQSLLHSVHHRGELSIVMTGLGYPLPTLDPILMYIRESGQDWPWE